MPGPGGSETALEAVAARNATRAPWFVALLHVSAAHFFKPKNIFFSGYRVEVGK